MVGVGRLTGRENQDRLYRAGGGSSSDPALVLSFPKQGPRTKGFLLFLLNPRLSYSASAEEVPGDAAGHLKVLEQRAVSS